MLYVAGEISGDSWGIFAFLCAALWNLPAVPALNSTDEVGAGQSIQKTYDLTRYLEHQLRTLAGTYMQPLRPQPSVLSMAERLQRIRKSPCRSKEDMLHEVMQHSTNENKKVQEWRERERRVHQQNGDCRHQSTEWLISIMESQADSIQVLVAMQAEHYRAYRPLQLLGKVVWSDMVAQGKESQNSFPCATMSLQTTFPNIWVLTATHCLQHL
ncbi:cardiotrophin-like cytokine factor 1 isoform X2 [Natator depressus]|uniref:cardiotrophin-like cytokine factor 1 isoform X2 n=1 Tax=Natator depressus TaxID=27790 RepID=UPI003EB6E0FE